MTIIIEKDEAKTLAVTMFASCITLITGTLAARKGIDLVIKKAAKKKKEDES